MFSNETGPQQQSSTDNSEVKSVGDPKINDAMNNNTQQSVMSMSLASLDPPKPQPRNLMVKPSTELKLEEDTESTSDASQPKPRSAKPKRLLRKQQTYAGLSFRDAQNTEVPDLSDYQKLRANALKALQESKDIMNSEISRPSTLSGKSFTEMLDAGQSEKTQPAKSETETSPAAKQASPTPRQEDQPEILSEPIKARTPPPPESDDVKPEVKREDVQPQEPTEQPQAAAKLTRQQRRERLRKQATFHGLSAHERPQELQVNNEPSDDSSSRRSRRQLRKQASDYDNLTPTEPSKSSEHTGVSRKRSGGAESKADTPKYDNVPDETKTVGQQEGTDLPRQRCVPKWDYETGQSYISVIGKTSNNHRPILYLL